MAMPGPMELLIILIVGVLLIGVPAAVIVLLVLLVRKQDTGQRGPSYSELVEENRRLREELASLKGEGR